MALEEAEAGLLRAQLAKSNIRVAGSSLVHRSLLAVLTPFLPPSLFLLVLEDELEKMCHCLGKVEKYVGAHGSSLVERLDNISCRVQDIVDFGVHRGALVRLWSLGRRRPSFVSIGSGAR